MAGKLGFYSPSLGTFFECENEEEYYYIKVKIMIWIEISYERIDREIKRDIKKFLLQEGEEIGCCGDY